VLAAILNLVLLLGFTAAVLYRLISFAAARSFFRRRPAPSHFLPPVTVLKPVKGIDEEAHDNFDSFCRQSYPQYQLLFGVSRPDDPAVPLIQTIIAEHPELDISLVIATESLGVNGKVSTLCQMLPKAKHPFLIVSDSDMRVQPDYLQRVVAPFADPRIGLVTTLYRGRGAKTTGAILEALTVNTDFFPSVLVAERLEGLSFALGATMAIRLKALEAIGGFFPLVNYLADDYQLGNRVCRANWRLELSEVIVDHVVPTETIREFFGHQLRWARTYRVCRPGGYFLTLLTRGMFFATALVLLNPGAPIAYRLWIGYLVLRLGTAAWLQAKLGEFDSRHLWLLPVRDLLAVGIWAAAFLGHTVTWRGETFRITSEGKMIPAGRARTPS